MTDDEVWQRVRQLFASEEEFVKFMESFLASQDEARPLLDWMRKHNVSITRKNYLNLAYPEGRPRPWTVEHERELPPELQRGPSNEAPPHLATGRRSPYIPRMTRDRIAGLIIAPLLIAVGVVIYEGSFVFSTHPLVFWSGANLVLAGGLWLASDWFGL
jgi:hypothetical protein